MNIYERQEKIDDFIDIIDEELKTHTLHQNALDSRGDEVFGIEKVDELSREMAKVRKLLISAKEQAQAIDLADKDALEQLERIESALDVELEESVPRVLQILDGDDDVETYKALVRMEEENPTEFIEPEDASEHVDPLISHVSGIKHEEEDELQLEFSEIDSSDADRKIALDEAPVEHVAFEARFMSANRLEHVKKEIDEIVDKLGNLEQRKRDLAKDMSDTPETRKAMEDIMKERTDLYKRFAALQAEREELKKTQRVSGDVSTPANVEHEANGIRLSADIEEDESIGVLAPPPAMMIGYHRRRTNSISEILEELEAGEKLRLEEQATRYDGEEAAKPKERKRERKPDLS